jgi:signal transduction histidine kinase
MAPFSRWRAPRSRVPLLVVLLVLTLSLTVVLAREAHQSSVSHHRVAQNVLRDYVEFASWEFGRSAQGELTHMYETGIAIASRAIPHGGAAAATEDVTGIGDFVPRTCEGCTPPLPPLTVFRMDPHTNRIVYRGAPLDDAIVRYLREVQPRIRQMLGTDPPCSLIIRAWDPPNGPQLVVGFTMTGGSKRDGTLPELHGFTGDRAVVAQAVARIVEKKPLLPPSLTKHAAGTPVLSARVRDETGTLVYESPDFAEAVRDRTQAHVAASTLDQMSGRLKYEIALRPSMAESLVIGGLPRSRVALLLGLLALTTGLVVVALVQLRREYELARLRSEFVSGVSHELRTPLAQIRMFSETLLLGRVRSDQEARRSLEIILQESRRLGHLVDNVLQFSKGQHRAARLMCEPRPLAPLLREVVDAFAPLARARRVTLRLAAIDDVTAPVDASALRQIVLNLLDNAVKYGPSDQTVTVRIAYEDGTARLSVEDEGPGIAAADAARIWAPFARLPQASAAGVAGAGIGLSVVRELTQLHGGRVTVTTGASGGARFCVELPHATVGQPGAPRPTADAATGDAATDHAATDDATGHAAALPAARSLTA